MSNPNPGPRPRSSRNEPVKQHHPNVIAHSLLLQAADLLTKQRKHSPVSVKLPAKERVRGENVNDVIGRMYEQAHKHELIVLYYDTDNFIWLRAL